MESMSGKTVQEIVLKAQEDVAFMRQLLSDPANTLKDYELTPTERAFFKSADEKTLRGLSPACFKLADQAKPS